MYCIYRITNNINGKAYIGKHQYFNENDPMGKYKGSGKILKQAYSKYGVENFSIEILKSRIPSEEVNEREKEYIAAERAFGKAQYNIQKGGQGGWILDFNKKDSEEYKKWHEQMLKMNRSEERRKKLSEARKNFLRNIRKAESYKVLK